MDFLANGFHQFYSELEDEHPFWGDCMNGTALTDFEIEVNNYGNNHSYSSAHCSYNNNRSCDYYSYVDNNESFELSNILINDYGRSFDTLTNEFENSLDCMNSEFSSENDWEHSFLDNYVELPALTDLLPERTPLCNESCNVFLKESSDNLIKFRPNYTERYMKETKSVTQENDGEKMFQCTFDSCTKVYAKPAHLKAHIRRHLGDKPYVCNWPNCSWKFSRSDELARHRRSHSGVKPYKCIYCTKCFSRSDHLAKHRKVHERKIAANKLKGIILANISQVKPGRKPKESKTNRC